MILCSCLNSKAVGLWLYQQQSHHLWFLWKCFHWHIDQQFMTQLLFMGVLFPYTYMPQFKSIIFKLVINPGSKKQVVSFYIWDAHKKQDADQLNQTSSSCWDSMYRVGDHLNSTRQQTVSVAKSEHQTGQKGKVCSCWWLKPKVIKVRKKNSNARQAWWEGGFTYTAFPFESWARSSPQPLNSGRLGVRVS